MDDSRIKDVTNLLSSFFNSDKLRQGERVADFFASWANFVGPRLAAHSRVMDVDKGILIIEAEHPGWIQLLQIRQTSILEDISRHYPELALRGIAFKLSGQDKRVSAEPPKTNLESEIELSSIIHQEPAQTTSLDAIEDKEFRNLLQSLKNALHGKQQ